jgi:hypothetical protein
MLALFFSTSVPSRKQQLRIGRTTPRRPCGPATARCSSSRKQQRRIGRTTPRRPWGEATPCFPSSPRRRCHLCSTCVEEEEARSNITHLLVQMPQPRWITGYASQHPQLYETLLSLPLRSVLSLLPSS